MPSKPKLGQNFLEDAQAIQRIVAALGDCAGQTVAEIGPGKGAVTKALVAKARHVLAIELDTELANRLRSEFSADRVTVFNEDVLQFDFAAAAHSVGGRLSVVGNLPYYITSPILLKLAANLASLDRAVVMMQREVADRVVATSGSRDYGVLSVTLQMYGSLERLFTLPPWAFSPAPEVYSSVVRWQFAPRFAALKVEETSFLAFVRKAFAQKRKTFANNLRAAGLSQTAIDVALNRSGAESRARAEEMSIEMLAELWNHLRDELSARLT